MLITNVTGNFFLKENDTATEMHLAVQEVDGTPIDLSAASKVEVVIGTLEGRYLTKTPTLLDKTGEFTFGLDEGDMLPTGDNLLEVHIFDNNNSKRVAPSKGHYKLKVQRTIGALGLTVTTYTLDYFLSEVNRILFGLPQLLARGEALADRMDVLIEESEQGLDEMYTATDSSRTATANSIEATAAAELATQDAQRATVEADTATAEAIQATTEADNATRDSIAQTIAAQTATQNANAAAQFANEYGEEAKFQAFQAENATVDAQDATRAANTATDNANAASSRANTSAGRADTATTNATNAANAANTAATEANTARDSANLAASLADGIATELRGYDNSIATFSLETRYLKHQPVRFDGSTYKAKVETQGNPLPVAPARSNEWFDLVAEKGEKGDMGTGISILGKVGSVSELPASGSPGDAYLIGVNIHIWDGDGWLDGGTVQGPQGEIGPQGEVGVGLQYSWNGSQLGVKRADESTYTYRDLQGPQGLKGDNAKIITLDFIIPATDGTQVDGNLINVHDYVYDAAADSIQFYQNSRILYPGEDFEMEDGTFRLLNWTGYDDPANVTFYIKVTRSVFDIDPVQSHATVVGALGYTPANNTHLAKKASTTELGHVMVGNNLTIDTDGKLHAVGSDTRIVVSDTAPVATSTDRGKLFWLDWTYGNRLYVWDIPWGKSQAEWIWVLGRTLVVDNLTTYTTDSALSARMGAELNSKIPTLNNTLTSTSTTQAATANAVRQVNDLKANRVQGNWIIGTLQNGWLGDFKYFKDEFGIVHVQMAIYGGTTTANTSIATLPNEYIPSSQTFVSAFVDGNVNVQPITIDVTGNIKIYLRAASGGLYFYACFRAK